MSDVIGVRVSGRERGVLLELTKELGDASFSQVFRIGLYSLKDNKNIKLETRKLLTQLYDVHKHEMQRSITKFQLTKLMMVNNQIKLIDKLKRQGIPEKNLCEIRKSLEEELRSVGIDYVHTDKQGIRFKKKR